MSDSDQFEFAFPDGSTEPEVATPWRAEWLRAAEDLCRRLAVPLNRRAEVRLIQGPILRGKLCLAEEQLWPDGNRHRLLLRIDRTTFRLGEMESVLRLDDLVGAAGEAQKPPAPPDPET
ncbi:MAG: hypothetical protein QOE70_5850 [Chthoniobacter sp.]|jgi:hypothetical protein|nr:hypothetical protein [Chthoniobacter sp.]